MCGDEKKSEIDEDDNIDNEFYEPTVTATMNRLLRRTLVRSVILIMKP
jgi:hypothetical protein